MQNRAAVKKKDGETRKEGENGMMMMKSSRVLYIFNSDSELCFVQWLHDRYDCIELVTAPAWAGMGWYGMVEGFCHTGGGGESDGVAVRLLIIQ